MSDTSQGPGWWQASDGKWYPPEQAPGFQPTPPAAPTGSPAQPGQPQWDPQPSSPVFSNGSPPEKKSNATRNVVIVLVVVFLLAGGGCAALLLAGGAAVNEVAETVSEGLREEFEPNDAEIDDDADSGAVATTVPPVEESDATCVYTGTGGLMDDMQVEVTFTNPHGEVNDLDLTFALLDGEGGTRFATESLRFSLAHLGQFPRPNEEFRVPVSTGENVPPNIDETTIGCTVLEIETKRFDIGGYARASESDTCEVVGVDSSGRIQVELNVTNPYDNTTAVQTWWALQAPGPVRFDVDTEVTHLVGAGETFRITPQYGKDKPEWVGDGEVTCAVLGFWEHPG